MNLSGVIRGQATPKLPIVNWECSRAHLLSPVEDSAEIAGISSPSSRFWAVQGLSWPASDSTQACYGQPG
jgi:hypothetical protein